MSNQRACIAEMIVYLGELDARRAHVDKGFDSLFAYCMARLNFSEDEACRRIAAARLARQFPEVVGLLSCGSITLTVAGLAKPHLNSENRAAVLSGLTHKSTRAAKEWLAARFPVADAPARIRQLPRREVTSAEDGERHDHDHEGQLACHTTAPSLDGASEIATPPSRQDTPAPRFARRQDNPVPAVAIRQDNPAPAVGIRQPTATPAVAIQQRTPALASAIQQPAPASADRWPSPAPTASPPVPDRKRPRIEPLSADRFALQVTISRALRDRVELARHLMSHRNPSRDLEAMLDAAVEALVAKLERERLGRTARPLSNPRPAKGGRVVSSTRRQVVDRDGLGCAFVSEDGHRCGSRAFLEFDHITPKGLGGDDHPDRIRLLCRSHNYRAAELAYGTERMRRASRRREREG